MPSEPIAMAPSKQAARPQKSEADSQLIRLALHRSPFFTCLDDEQRERFVQAVELKVFRPGQAVILEGCRDERDEEEADKNEIDNDFVEPASPSSQHVPLVDTALADTDDLLDWVDVDESETTEKDEDSVNNMIESQRQESEDAPARILVDGSEHEIIARQHPAEQTPHERNVQTQSEKHDPLDVEDNVRPPPAKSGSPSYLYVIRKGKADVFYESINPASLGPGTVFGEGGFLFGRQHSASIVASSVLECWVIDYPTFSKCLQSENLKMLFSKYARHQDVNEEMYMTMQDFIQSCTELDATDDQRQTTGSGLSIANTYQNILLKSHDQSSMDSKIHLADFCLFHLLITRPDPEVDIAFLLMDRRKTGSISKKDFSRYLSNIPYFHMNSEFVQRHFGKDGKQIIRTYQFPQFLVDLQREIGRQAFVHQVELIGTREGYLPQEEFVLVLKNACGWRLPLGVADRLESIFCKGPIKAGEAAAMASVRAGTIRGGTPEEVVDYSKKSILSEMEYREKNLGTRYFNYTDFLAFQEVLGHIPGICNLIARACEIKKGSISPDDFKVANRVLGLGGRLSRLQVDIIFQLFDLDKDGFISAEDADSVVGLECAYRLEAVKGREGKFTFAPPPDHRDAADFDSEIESQPIHLLSRIFYHATQFLLASIAGGVGILAVYPLDFVKTRMMNQRIGVDGTRMYLQSFDCLWKTVQYEGFFGLYRGLLPPLLAVGPEKAIKFAVNDLLKGLSNKDDESRFHWLVEMLSGGCAGACQLLVTNPLEITKIRMQMQGETARLFKARGRPVPKPLSFSAVAADLGLSGLYKGAAACLLRDIPFGAIYFPTYTFCKDYLVNREGSNDVASASDLLLAGTMAGIPAAFLTTPSDFIKTRLQVIARPGELAYTGIRDCLTKVYETEGPTAFFKGSAFRVSRIAPQFGISLLCYEKLSQFIGLKTPVAPTNAPIDPRDYRTAFPTRAIGTKMDDIDNLIKNMGFRHFPSSKRDNDGKK
jgi:solute carrier family 25 aspartate/glutamate transporter 12/13